MRAIGIGELSRQTTVPIANIRYYEEIGILPKAERRNGRHRSYAEADVRRLNFVRNSRELGFSLDQVRHLLHLSEPGNSTCAEARALSVQQIACVREKIKELRKIELELSRHVAFCDANCACGRTLECPVLERETF